MKKNTSHILLFIYANGILALASQLLATYWPLLYGVCVVCLGLTVLSIYTLLVFFAADKQRTSKNYIGI